MNRKLCALALVVMALPGWAEDGRLTGEASMGLLNTSGNTSTRSLNLKAALGYQSGAWSQTGKLSALNAQEDHQTTDERYGAGYKVTYDFTPHDYAFGTLDYESNRFAGITQRLTEALGYGRRLLATPQHTLDLEVGAGTTQQRLATQERENSAVGLLNGKYQWRISDTSKFTQTVKIEQSSQNTFVNPLSELKLVIAGNLFTTLAYELRYNSEAPVGTRHTDTLTSVNLGYGFGKAP